MGLHPIAGHVWTREMVCFVLVLRDLEHAHGIIYADLL